MTTDERIATLERELEKSNKTIEILLNRTNRQADIMERLIGGLYHPDEQRHFKEMLFQILDENTDSVSMEEPDTSRWQQDPTTSQGYALEKMVNGFEERISKIEDRVDSFESCVDDIFLKIVDMQGVVHTLIGGLFNIDTQNTTVSKLVSRLYGKSNCSKDKPDTSIWESRPTTAQGDHAEKRLEALERKVFTV